MHRILLALLILPLLNACDHVTDMVDGMNLTAPPIFATSADALIHDGCPDIKIVDELSAMINFKDTKFPSENEMTTRMDIDKANRSCTYNNKTMTVDVTLDFTATMGMYGTPGTYDYPFFVAVTAPGGKIVAKEIFDTKISFSPGEQTTTHTEKLRHIIPVSSETHGKNHIVMVGFQLTPAQLDFNRVLIRQKEQAMRNAQAVDPALTTTTLTTQDLAPPPTPTGIPSASTQQGVEIHDLADHMHTAPIQYQPLDITP